MSFEVKIDDIPFNFLYSDERCKKLEHILQQEPEFSEFKVKRLRTDDDPTQDPYFIINEEEDEGAYMMWLNEWEVDVLDDSEMLSYITVTIKTSKRADPAENWMLVACFFAALFLSLILLYFIIPEFQTYSFYPLLIISSLLPMVVFGIIAYYKSKTHSQKKRELDIQIMQQHPLFIEAIRKFAALTNISDAKRAEYEKRLEELESMLQNGFVL